CGGTGLVEKNRVRWVSSIGPDDSTVRRSLAEAALSEGRHTSRECDCLHRFGWHGRYDARHHQPLLSIRRTFFAHLNWISAWHNPRSRMMPPALLAKPAPTQNRSREMSSS